MTVVAGSDRAHAILGYATSVIRNKDEDGSLTPVVPGGGRAGTAEGRTLKQAGPMDQRSHPRGREEPAGLRLRD